MFSHLAQSSSSQTLNQVLPNPCHNPTNVNSLSSSCSLLVAEKVPAPLDLRLCTIAPSSRVSAPSYLRPRVAIHVSYCKGSSHLLPFRLIKGRVGNLLGAPVIKGSRRKRQNCELLTNSIMLIMFQRRRFLDVFVEDMNLSLLAFKERLPKEVIEDSKFVPLNEEDPSYGPPVAKQNDTHSCGYYVMINMMTIVSATITNNWKKVFNSTDPFTSEELKDIRQVWAEFFLRLYEERKLIGKEERTKKKNQLK